MKRVAIVAAAALGAACAHNSAGNPGAATEVLGKRPALEPLQPFAAPVPEVVTLANGLKLFVVEKPGDGIEALSLVVRSGAAQDPANLPGLASLSLEMLEAGSAGRSQTEMAAAADAIGASLNASAGSDGSVIGASAMATQLDKLVALFADLALKPNFAEADWKRLLGRREAELLAQRAEPREAASRAFARAVYGDHPYGRPADGTLESVKAMKLDDARAFFAGFRPEEAALVAVGGADKARVVELLRNAFETWRGASAPIAARPQPQLANAPTERPKLVIVDFKGRPQTVMRVGEPAVPRKSPDALALRLWSAVVGGSFTSRLNQNLREAHAWTYGARAGFSFGVGPGPFVAAADVKTANTADALKETLAELHKALEAPLSDAEIEKGKALLAFGLVEGLQHADGVAGIVGQLFLYDLPNDELATFVPRLSKLTAADVQAAAKRAVAEQGLTIVFAGDQREIEAQLAQSGLSLPAPQMRDAVGELVAGK
jgi:predicted Zn-dependent peptidase